MDTVDRRVYYTLCRDTGLAKSQAGAVKKKKKTGTHHSDWQPQSVIVVCWQCEFD